MIRPINHDTFLLSQKSVPATKADISIVNDLTDTLRANLDRCVGMAANMIGINKRIIAVAMGPMVIPMINPIILRKAEPYEAVEGCLSLPGERKTTRYQTIDVEYQDVAFNTRKQTYTGFIAQIIQHEVDHCDGILI